MSLVRVWRRQLYGASTAALIVPTAMLAALIALALGGAFSGVGVLGQLFAGPSLPVGDGGSGVASSGGHGGAARPVTTASLTVIPLVARVGVRRVLARRAPVVSSAGRGVRATGGAIAPVGGTVRPVSQGSGGGAGGGQGSAPVHSPSSGPSSGPGSGPGPGSSSGPGSAPAPPAPQPSPPPQPTPVDKVVTVVTNVTQQVPAPVGPVATQAVQAAGSAADKLLPAGGQSVP